MRALSISAAWEETKAILAHDGRLLITVALALVALPAAVNSLVNPNGVSGTSTPLWLDLIALIASLIALAGQLALIRLAIGPSITVGSAIAHGIRRVPIYLGSVLLIAIGFVIVIVPLGLLLSALGVPMQARGAPPNAATVAVALFCLALICFVAVRFILSAPLASAEPIGPIAILRRSWSLTSGHWWQLFGFLLMFVVGAVVTLIAVGTAVGVAVGLFIGSIQPLSAGALILALVQALISAAITTLFAMMLARIYLQLAGREAQASVPSSGI
jgi:hypothetical protein